MAVIDDKPVWEAKITQIDPNDPVQGGAGGVDNVPHEQLANRTAYLKKQFDEIVVPPDSSDGLNKETQDRKAADKKIADWQSQHTLVLDEDGRELDPHQQYVTYSAFNQTISNLLALIRGISQEGSGGNELISLLELQIDSRTANVLQKEGFEFKGYTDIVALGVSTRTSGNPISPRNYTFAFNLPSEYNPDIHRVIGTGAPYNLDEAKGVVYFSVSTKIRSSSRVNGGETITTYLESFDYVLRVEIYGQREASAPSGSVLGRLDITYSDSVRSQNDFGGYGVVTVNEKSGFGFTYPSTFKLATPTSNNANSYNRDITITLPPEYDPTKHTVSAFTSNGTYVVNELAGTVVFTARVSSSRDGEGVVTDSMTASFKVSIVA